MTENPNTELPDNALNAILSNGLEGLPEAISTLINHAMLIERERHLGAAAYQRTEQRDGRANGFKERTLATRIGPVDLRIPQVRDCSEPFYPTALERGQRSEKALAATLAEMYLQGVSTRRVTKVMETLCGFQVSSNQVSKATKELDEQIEAWRTRPIEPIAHLVLDAMYEDVRYDKLVRRCAVLIAVGVRVSDGKRTILGVSVSLSEAEVHWRDFLRGLKERGLELPKSITSDAHEGLRAALGTIFPASPWQRCQFHLQQNAQAYVPKVTMREEVAADIRDIFNAPGSEEAKLLLDKTIIKYQKSAPELSTWMENALPEGFTIFELPKAVRKRLRTSNMIENLNKQIRRRTRVVSIFPNKESCLRLISSILMEQSDDWESGRAYLNPKHLS
ncbi:IS256 family transposase [Akkermansiaceae bacterium]|nr:IS256 family transposase [Akkermansiaceae bacterium]